MLLHAWRMRSARLAALMSCAPIPVPVVPVVPVVAPIPVVPAAPAPREDMGMGMEVEVGTAGMELVPPVDDDDAGGADALCELVLAPAPIPGDCCGWGASPENRMGSDEPVSKDAAVAAAATLNKVPNTSILLGEIGP